MIVFLFKSDDGSEIDCVRAEENPTSLNRIQAGSFGTIQAGGHIVSPLFVVQLQPNLA